jgi:ubiquinone/menaquinone biosynthesis C-methylase UbiE
MGADFMRWVRAGAAAVGCDLTDRAIELTRERAAAEGTAAAVCVADAERLPFASASRDLVYSWGVLHHTPGTATALGETIRVLAPGGRLKVMLYHRRSWFALAAWVRFGLLRGRPFTTLKGAVAHVESPGTQAFTVAEVEAMLAGLVEVTVRPSLTHWDRKWLPGISRLGGNRFGWFLLAEGRKPA